MNSEDAFLQAILDDPTDAALRLMFADWLEEHGDRRGELLRIQEQLRAWGAESPPERPETEARMLALLDEGMQPVGPFITNSLGMRFALIFPGEFMMGSPESEERREFDESQVSVQLTRPFYLAVHTVTQKNWRALMRNEPWSGKEDVKKGANYPAIYIDWDDAVEFCQKLTEQERRASRLPQDWEYRPPTEAQWEYASRAGATTAYFFGDDASKLSDYAWFEENARDVGNTYAHKVGRLRPNAWGLCDMHGNVWEWCRASYQEKLPGGTNPETIIEDADRLFLDRIYRGGSWSDTAGFCRSACRNWHEPWSRESYLGFRVATVPVR